MNQSYQTNEYDALIKKIKRRRRAVIVITLIVLFATIIACSPIYIGGPGETIVDHDGINPVVTVLLVLFIFICELIAYAMVSLPLTASMDVEADPQKHLALNIALNKRMNESIYSCDLLYLGDFGASLAYAERMLTYKKAVVVNFGLFNKARCQFFMGDIESFRLTAKQFEAAVSDDKKASEKIKAIYDRYQRTINLMASIADKDVERIDSCRKTLEVWNKSKAVQGYIDYLKGIAAYHVGDRKESIYRLTLVKENCGKTVFAKLAEPYLENL